jgi:rhodanese-related sulfurtransferase
MRRSHQILLCLGAAVLAAAAGGRPVESVDPAKAYELLKAPSTYLVDVRSIAEYVLVGHPEPAFNIPYTFWSEKPATFEPNAGFIQDLKSRFKPEDRLLFICRSGGRSLRAAQEAAAAGFVKAVNVTQGVEGEMDAAGHRTVGGWKGAGLPWTYKVDPEKQYRAR